MSGQLSILIYHRVLAAQDPLQPGIPDAARFEAHIRALARFFRVLPLEEAVQRLRDGCLPSRALAITFDDGYRDNVDVALPILSRLGVPATFFIATGYLDGGVMWNDRIIEATRKLPVGASVDLAEYGVGAFTGPGNMTDRRELFSRLVRHAKYQASDRREAMASRLERIVGQPTPSLMMDASGTRALAEAGMTLGAHTRSHPILTLLDDLTARREIEESRSRLQSLTDQAVNLFAYPNGVPGRDYDARHVAMVREAGFTAALSTAWGTATKGADLWQLPRFTPWDRSSFKFCLRLAYRRGCDRLRRRAGNGARVVMP